MAPKKSKTAEVQSESAPNTFTLYFNPSRDITAFELASILLTMPLGPGQKPIAVAGITATEEEWKRVPPPLRRYFVKDSPWGARLTQAAPPPPPQFPQSVVDPGPRDQAPSISQQILDAFGTKIEGQPVILPQNRPSPQPPRPVPSLYHHEGVDSLLPEGMSVAPAPEGS
jgi:hypothetical protein